MSCLPAGLLTCLVACVPDATEPPPPSTRERESRPLSEPTIQFLDQAAEAGLDFQRFNGMSGRRYLAEITCGGGALFDADQDGDLDVYLLQGRLLVGRDDVGREGATFEVPHAGRLVDRLYRNDLGSSPATGLHFTDVTREMGVAADGYGCAVTSGDFDGDGRTDLYVLNLGANQLLRNLGPSEDGGVRFEDITERAGVAAPGPGTAAVAFDIEPDGDLDLFVANYSDFDPKNEQPCFSLVGAPDYCGPGAYPSRPDRLLRNRGDGTFEDVSESAGLHAVEPRPALGAVAADFDGDGHLDLYVANDGEANHLWMSRGDGTFREDALLAGCAVNAYGAAEASMGVDAADVDDDGDWDLVLAHLDKETHTIYLNDGHGAFTDATAALGLGPPSVPFTGFGIVWLDVDLDGRLDLAVAHGAVTEIADQVVAGDRLPLRQANLLLRLDSSRGLRYVDVSPTAGPGFVRPGVARGLAVGDLDNDGDPDLLLTEVVGPARLLINQAIQAGQEGPPWIGVRLVTQGSPGKPPRDALGAKAALLRNGRATSWRRATTDGSYASARDPRLIFALVDHDAVAVAATVRVVWPGGRIEDFPGLAPRRYETLQQGRGVNAP